MDPDESARQAQIAIHQRRLRILRDRAALQGVSTPPEVLMEIEDIARQIQALDPLALRGGQDGLQPGDGDADLKYYVYISDVKLDILYPQLPASLRATNLEDTRIARLGMVVRFLEQKNLIGSTDDPRIYFRATLPMRRGPISQEMMFFHGMRDRMVVALCGYTSEAMDRRDMPLTVQSTWLVQRELKAFLSKDQDYAALGPEHESAASESDALARTVQAVQRSTRGPIENLEFIAKKLFFGSVAGSPVLLGTPLYVALAD
jgi:hypothetical protein